MPFCISELSSKEAGKQDCFSLSANEKHRKKTENTLPVQQYFVPLQTDKQK